MEKKYQQIVVYTSSNIFPRNLSLKDRKCEFNSETAVHAIKILQATALDKLKFML